MKKGLVVLLAVAITVLVVKQGLKYVVEHQELLTPDEELFIERRKTQCVGQFYTSDDVEAELFGEVGHDS